MPIPTRARTSALGGYVTGHGVIAWRRELKSRVRAAFDEEGRQAVAEGGRRVVDGELGGQEVEVPVVLVSVDVGAQRIAHDSVGPLHLGVSCGTPSRRRGIFTIPIASCLQGTILAPTPARPPRPAAWLTAIRHFGLVPRPPWATARSAYQHDTRSGSGGGRGEAIRNIYYRSDRQLPPGHDPGADSGEAPGTDSGEARWVRGQKSEDERVVGPLH
jgi:hypothetical protein